MLQGILPLVIVFVVLAIVIGLNFILIPSVTIDAIESTNRFRENSMKRARSSLGEVRGYWTLQGERREHERLRQRFISKRKGELAINRSLAGERDAFSDSFDSADDSEAHAAADKELGKAWESTPILVVSAWLRRVAYLVLVSGLAVGFYVVTEPVMELIVGKVQDAPNLYGLLQHTQLLTGIVLMSCVALAGLLIAEYPPDEPALKIALSTPKPLKIIYLILAILMGLIDVGAITSLAIVGIDFEMLNRYPTLAAVIVLIGMVISLALGLLLAFNAMMKNLGGLVWIVLGGLFALVMWGAGIAAGAGSWMLRGLLRLSQSRRTGAQASVQSTAAKQAEADKSASVSTPSSPATYPRS